MAGGKETPRQKMIGMMYLVLLAMLAMNVSKEVLNSFILIDDALSNTNENFGKKIQANYAEFDKQMLIDENKTKPWKIKADKAHKASSDMIKYIQDTKKQVIAFTEGHEANFGSIEAVPDSMWLLKNLNAKDNYDKPTEMMIGPNEAAPKEGDYTAVDLHLKLQKFIDEMNEVLGEEGRKQVTIPLNFDEIKESDGRMVSWEIGNFYHIPLAAVVTNLSRFESEVRNAEADVLKYLLGKISGEDFSFDRLDVRVVPRTDYVVMGDSFVAEVVIAASNSTKPPQLRVGSDIDTAGAVSEWTVTNELEGAVKEQRVQVDGSGVASYRFKPTSEGEVTWGGFLEVLKPGSTDDYEKRPFKHSFIVAKPSLVISPTAVNVFYKGVDNPVDISVSGIASSKLQPSISGGTLKKVGDGKYIVRANNSVRKAKISVSAKMGDGSTKNFGDMEFRVKSLPIPNPYVAGVEGQGEVNLALLKSTPKVFATLKDFLFEVTYNVVSFELIATVDGRKKIAKSNSANISGEMKQIIGNQRRGDLVTFQSIKAVGPDGNPVLLSPVVITVK